MSTVRRSRVLAGYVLRSSWPWMAMWSWLLYSSYGSLLPTLAPGYSSWVAFEGFLAGCGWLLVGAVMLAGSSSEQSFWRGRPVSPGLFLSIKLFFLTLLMLALPFWLEGRMLSSVGFSFDSWSAGQIFTMFAGGMAIPALLACLFPSWLRFLSAGLGLVLLYQLVRFAGPYFWVSRWSAMGLVLASLVLMTWKYLRPQASHLNWIAAGLFLVILPTGYGVEQLLSTASANGDPQPSVAGAADIAVRLSTSEKKSNLPDADHRELFGRWEFSGLDERSSYTARLVSSRFRLADGPSWTAAAPEGAVFWGREPKMGHEAVGDQADSAIADAPVLIIPAAEADPYLDRPGYLELELEVEAKAAKWVGTLNLEVGEVMPWQSGILRIERIRRETDELYLQVAVLHQVEQSKTGNTPDLPQIKIPGWLSALEIQRLTGLEPRTNGGVQWPVRGFALTLLRDVSLYFPRFLRLRIFHSNVLRFYPDPRGVQESPAPERIEVWESEKRIVSRQSRRLSVTMADLDGTGRSHLMWNVHKDNLMAVREASHESP